MSMIFHIEDDKQHFTLETNRADILLAIQIPVALTALAALFFLA